MKKIRYLPFGYTIRNGHTVIEQQEADIVRNIFRSYIQGASLKEIAGDLTAKQIPYTERTCVWDKARISRILENAKYIGDEEFETIIDEDIYEEAAAVKSARHWNQAVQESEGIRQIRDRVRCGQCGAPMLRHINSKREIRESWTCSNADISGVPKWSFYWGHCTRTHNNGSSDQKRAKLLERQHNRVHSQKREV